MAELARAIATVISAADGRVVGRIKIQKMLYLLAFKGLDVKPDFYYHYYGPYSDNVSDAIMDGKFYGLIKERIEYRKADGAPFSIFEVGEDAGALISEGIEKEKFESYVRSLNQVSSTVIELAATIHWLAHVEKVADWRLELGKRKSGKATPERVERALELLQEIDLAV